MKISNVQCQGAKLGKSGPTLVALVRPLSRMDTTDMTLKMTRGDEGLVTGWARVGLAFLGLLRSVASSDVAPQADSFVKRQSANVTNVDFRFTGGSGGPSFLVSFSSPLIRCITMLLQV